MALDKKPVQIDFTAGLDQTVDPYSLPVGTFQALNNVVQNKQGLLEKRPGNIQLASLPNSTYSYLTTFNGNLTAISQQLSAYIQEESNWVTKGTLPVVKLNTLPLVRNSSNQTQADIALGSNGLLCTAYTEQGIAKFVVASPETGQNVIPPTVLLADTGTVSGPPRIFFAAGNWIILYSTTDSGVDHIAYTAINQTSLIVSAPTTLVANYTEGGGAIAFDATVYNNNLYVGWNHTSSMLFGVLQPSFVFTQASTVFTGFSGEIVSLCVGITSGSTPTPIVYLSFSDTTTGDTNVGAFDINLNIIFTPQAIGLPSSTNTPSVAVNIVSAAQTNCTIYIEVANSYTYNSGIPTNFIAVATVTPTGIVSIVSVLAKSVGLASKPIFIDDFLYVLVQYVSTYQPTYFLLGADGMVKAKLAYGNAIGINATTALSNLVLNASGSFIGAYIYKDAVQAVNKNTNVPSGSQVAGVYSQTGVNLVTFTVSLDQLVSAEIGNNLMLNVGFLAGYDGYLPVENGFFLYPDSVELSQTTGGSMANNTYYYQVTYEWTDNQGNAFKSAPSIPVSITTTSSNMSVVLDIPTLRLTYKLANPVKIVIYRWSLTQQSYYQVTSITSPTLNDPSLDSISYTDTLSDDDILGNNLIYTTGGVVEDINGPAAVATTLFDTRLWLIDSEDQNLLWFSKQVIENTPVEMSDLFTVYIPPSTGTQGSTGVMRCLAPMDDKLVIFKDNAIYYINGTGPDNTGANNQYSQATFITTTVGCSNQRSIVLTPDGLMFQSNNGIWLLSRNLQTSYIGKDVQDFNGSKVLSAINVPQSTIVKFNLDSGTTLAYNYFFQRWSTETGVQPISSTIYQGLTSFIDSLGRTWLESPGSYLDGSNPVLISLTTSWFNLTGLQGFQRFYYMQMLGTYYSPHTLVVSIGYDYAANPSQQIFIQPDNYSPAWGSDASWGSGQQWGGSLPLEQWQIFPQIQKCQSFQISIQEQYDGTLGVAPGQGLSLSGLNMVVGLKKGYAKLSVSRQAG